MIQRILLATELHFTGATIHLLMLLSHMDCKLRAIL